VAPPGPRSLLASRPFSLAIVALAATVAQLPALRAGYVLDDDTLLASNPYVRTLSGLRTLLTSEFFLATARPEESAQYRPVSGAMNWLSWQLLGGSAPAQHALNIALHAGVTLVLWLALEALGASRRAAFGAAILFAVHPVATLNVGYAEGRQDLLGWIVVLGAAALVARARSALSLAATSFGATLVAAHCREAFAATFLWLALVALARPARRGAAAGAVLAGGAAALVVVALLRRAVGVTAYDTPPWHLADAVRASVATALRLLRDVVWPTDLSIYVTAPALGPAAFAIAALALALGAFACDRVLAAHAPGARPAAWLAFAIVSAQAAVYAMVVVTLGPLSDRYAYGTVVAAAFLVTALARATPDALPRVAGLAPPVLGVALLPMTWARGVTFRSEADLQAAMVEELPDDPEVQIALGLTLFAQGDLEAAYPHCEAYAQVHPSGSRPGLCIGSWLLVHGRPAEALAVLRPYALARPGYPNVRRTALAAAFAANDLDAAQAFLDAWEPLAPGAEELVEARQVLDRRRPR
jgi:tetratricopeptide (TPR) repeat protein